MSKTTTCFMCTNQIGDSTIFDKVDGQRIYFCSEACRRAAHGVPDDDEPVTFEQRKIATLERIAAALEGIATELGRNAIGMDGDPVTLDAMCEATPDTD